jgi:phosphoribosylformimino-5-aminoimidazole carboxamide ribotide isomerase
MQIFPAIDLMDGKAVRLEEGKREKLTVFHERPWELARQFVDAGAARLHVVDLEAAFAGKPVQLELVARLVAVAAEAAVPVQVGGGVRDRAALDALFAVGARLAVLGTAAVRDPAFVEDACRAHPGRVVVAVDARDGKVAVDGWTQGTTVDAGELAERASAWGAAGLLYTDIARDGLKRGPNVAATAALQARVPGTLVIASGGIGALDHLRALAGAGVQAAVVGRALYDGVFTLEQALAAC